MVIGLANLRNRADEQSLGARIAGDGRRDQRFDQRLKLADRRLRSWFGTGAASSSIRTLRKVGRRFGRPLGLPLAPGLKRVRTGGR